jgi:general stress protein YciG
VKSKRGFAAMSPERRRAIAMKGGISSRDKGAGHRYTPEEAREAQRISLAVRQHKRKRAIKGAA